MIASYLLKLAIMLPIIAGLAWGSVWLIRKAQRSGFGRNTTPEKLAVVDAISMGPAGKIAVVQFDDRRLLVAVGKNGISLIDEARAANLALADAALANAALADVAMPPPSLPYPDLIVYTIDEQHTPPPQPQPTAQILDLPVRRVSGLTWASVR